MDFTDVGRTISVNSMISEKAFSGILPILLSNEVTHICDLASYSVDVIPTFNPLKIVFASGSTSLLRTLYRILLFV